MIPKAPQTGDKPSGSANLRLLYLGYYMALGSLSPYIALYFQRSGLSGVQIGILSACILAMTSLTAIPWGTVVDRFQLHHRVLRIAFLFPAVIIFVLSRTSAFALMIPLVLGYAFFITPIVPLLDSSALAIARIGPASFGEIRVGGTIGWIISVWLVGVLIQAYDARLLFYAYAAFMGLTFVYVCFRPPPRAAVQVPAWGDLRTLLTDRSVVFFLLSIFLVAMGSGAVSNFFSLYMDGIGARESMIGVAWALAAVSEIPVMMYAGHIMRRIGAAGLLKIAFFVYALRWLLLSFTRQPGLALALQLLHGLSFAAFLTAGVTYLSQRTPEGLGMTAQAIFNVVSFGLASFAGALAGGYLYDHAGMALFFQIFSMITLAGLLLFWLSSARIGRPAYGTSV